MPLQLIKNLCKKVIKQYANVQTNYFTQWPGFLGYKRETFCKDMFFPLRKIEFEGTQYYCPRDMDSYLTQVYGRDYMELPPEEKRQNHYQKLINFNTEQTNEWEKIYDKD
jgi:lipopolysaccharide cholinephosphotransferase